MSMMGMTAILIFVYFTCIWLIVALLSHVKKTKYINITFVILNCAFFLALNMYYFHVRNNFRFMTFDNISPFTFTFMPFIFLFRKKIKDAFLAAISFLSVGMFIAMLITPQYAYLFHYNNEAGFDYLFDALCHLNCSLFGIYLIASGQVKLSFNNLFKSTVFMYGVITFGVLVNYIFHTNYFGMCPYGGFSIYYLDIFEEYWATLLAYYVGVFLVLSGGFFVNAILNKASGNEVAFYEVKIKKIIF